MNQKSHTESVIRTLEETKNLIESALPIFDYLHILPSGKLICIKKDEHQNLLQNTKHLRSLKSGTIKVS